MIHFHPALRSRIGEVPADPDLSHQDVLRPMLQTGPGPITQIADPSLEPAPGGAVAC